MEAAGTLHLLLLLLLLLGSAVQLLLLLLRQRQGKYDPAGCLHCCWRCQCLWHRLTPAAAAVLYYHHCLTARLAAADPLHLHHSTLLQQLGSVQQVWCS
jgi:hypothetical protein